MFGDKQKISHLKKLLLHLILILLFGKVAVYASEEDSIAIKSTIQGINIVAKLTSFYSEDCKVILIDSSTLKNNSHVSIAELLNDNYAATISSYGSEGSLNTISLRGGASRHTQVLWNGIPLNSVSNGSTDLSLVPSLVADQVHINFGAPASLYGSGTFGGAIELNNLPDWNKRFQLKLNTQLASFNSKSYALNTSFGSKKIQTNFTLYEQHADGNYTFFNAYKNEISERIHNEYFIYGSLVNVSLKPLKHLQINSGAWYQYKDKNIPPIISSYSLGSTNQIDESLKAYINANYIFSNAHITYSTALLKDYMLYTDIADILSSIYTVYSEFDNSSFINNLNFRYYFRNKFSFDVSGNFTKYHSKVLAYNQDINENEAAVVGAFKYISNKIIVNASIRQQMYSAYFSKTLYSVGLRYKLIGDKLELRSNFATKYRMPSFNDRFWLPGGNPDLQPEEGWSADLGILFLLHQTSFKLRIEVNPFYNAINNWIQWMPGEANYWAPISHKTVHSRGIELVSSISDDLFGGRIELNLFYTVKQSLIMSSVDETLIGNQLAYTPMLTGLNKLKYSYKGYSIIYALRYRGFSYINEQNNASQIMNGFWLHSLQVLKSFPIAKTNLNTSIKITNIANKNFEVIKEYPMPGRGIYFSIGIDL